MQVGVGIGRAAEQKGNDGGLKSRDLSLALGFGVNNVKCRHRKQSSSVSEQMEARELKRA